MAKRLAILTALLLSVGLVTHAFGQGTPVVPDESGMTRAGAVALLVESHAGMKQHLPRYIKNMPPMPLFSDVDDTQWYAPYIEVAFEAGLITGNPDKTFRPGDLLTEEEAIILGARYKAMSDGTIAAQLTSPYGSQNQLLNTAATISVQNGIKLPFPIRLGQPLRRGALYDMMASLGIQNPRTIALSHTTSKPLLVASVQPTPAPARIATSRPLAQPVARPVYQQPVVQQVTRPVATTTAPAPSALGFAISMPSLGINELRIAHPSALTKEGMLAPLNSGVGHLFSYPGKGGKVLVYGHSSDYAWKANAYAKIFRQINKLAIGDKVYVTYGGKVHTYQVTTKQTVPVSDFSAYQKGSGEELILYTCWPPDTANVSRYLVHAVPVDTVASR